MKRAAFILLTISFLVGLAGCAAMQKASYDPSKPDKICPSTIEGNEAKTFCY